MDPRDLFLRGVWASIPDEQNAQWVQSVARSPRTDTPLGDYGQLVRRMLDAGIAAEDIARFARIIGYETAFGILYLLSDPTPAFAGLAEEPEICFGLQAMDINTAAPIAPLNGLHESVLSMDPTGREMRPGSKG